ncbi:hypothetical protein EBR37_03470 [bacterium]|nr:hypothetical protein [bacterium]
MPKKSKISQLSQTHGQVERRPITLDQVWGDTGTNKYGTLDPKKYEDHINNLNKSDLQAHATKVGLVPIDDRNNLISRLKREFNKHISTFSQTHADKKINKTSKIAKDILSEGR